MVRRKILFFLLAMHGPVGAVQQFGIDGFSIACKSGTRAREVGDDPIKDLLQFHYITQDNYSCLIQLRAAAPSVAQAHVVLLTFDERYQKDPKTKRTITKSPRDYGIAGNYGFMYITRGANHEMLFGFINYGNNEAMRSFFEHIKLARNSVLAEEKSALHAKPPVAFKAIMQHVATPLRE